MKALILILLAAVYAAAQNPTPTVADIARQERARRAQGKSSKVYTTEDIRTAPAPAEIDPAANPDANASPGAPDGSNATPAPAPNAPGPTPAPFPAPPVASAAPTAPAPDPAQQWMLENEKLRQQLRDLMDQEATAQLEINAATNQLNAPVSSQSAKDQAAASIKSAQDKLAGIREKISKGRNELLARESAGPPRK
jgi:hypothetical protein